MTKIILLITVLFISLACADVRTHYVNGKWRVCDEKKFDSSGNMVYTKDGHGYYEYWSEYDSKGNMIHIKDRNGMEVWYEYDSKGNKIHERSNNGVERWYKYDSKGNVIYERDSEGYEVENKYDSKGFVSYKKFGNGIGTWIELRYKYDARGNAIRIIDNYGDEQQYYYDSKGNIVHARNDGHDDWYEYYLYEDSTDTWEALPFTYDYNRQNKFHKKPSAGVVIKCEVKSK